jgi:hypothetical protein
MDMKITMDFVNGTLHFFRASVVERTEANPMAYCIEQDHSRSQANNYQNSGFYHFNFLFHNLLWSLIYSILQYNP